MKVFRGLAFLITVSVVLSSLFFGCFTASFKVVHYEPGVYEGMGKGFRGPILVRVMVSQSGIEDIEVLDHQEDDAIGGTAIEELREYILDSGLPVNMIYLDASELDAVSGATVSGKGFLEALENALQKAR